MRLGVWGLKTKDKTCNFLKKRIIFLSVAVRQQQRLSVFELGFQFGIKQSCRHVASKGNSSINIATLMQ
jgi:hypothetical protein